MASAEARSGRTGARLGPCQILAFDMQGKRNEGLFGKFKQETQSKEIKIVPSAKVLALPLIRVASGTVTFGNFAQRSLRRSPEPWYESAWLFGHHHQS